MKIMYKRGVDLTSADAISRLDNLPPPSRDYPDDFVFSVIPGRRTCIEFGALEPVVASVQPASSTLDFFIAE